MLKKIKTQIRQEIKKREASIDIALKNELSLKIQHNLLESSFWRDAEIVGLYMPLADEAQTSLLLKEALNAKKLVLLPRCNPLVKEEAGRSMDFVPCNSLELLQPQKYGILEPSCACPALKPGQGGFIPDIKKTLFIIPGRAFDYKGGRLGRGAGYYDTYLANPLLKNVFLVGYGFSFSIYDSIPMEAHDIRMNALCTDKEFICFVP